MRKEVKEIIWHNQTERPDNDLEMADVLVRVLKTSNEPLPRVYYEVWQWFSAPHVTTGFYRDGQLLNDATYRPIGARILEFEWCYLAKAGKDDEFAVSIF